MSRNIRVAVQIPPGGTPNYAVWRDTVLRAEDVGVDVLLGYDHFVVPAITGIVDGRPVVDENHPPLPNFERWTALASWAEITSRAEIGLLVGGAGFRNPDLVADMARTVDHISGGRLILGLGAGWYEPDYSEYGYEFGTTSSRHAVFVDALERIENRLPKLLPPPVRKIPILIGGGGEKKTLSTVARFADIWHVHADVETFLRKNDIVIESAQRIGRDNREIERAVAWTNPDDADRFVDVGVTMFHVSVVASKGYDLTELKEALAWRDSQR